MLKSKRALVLSVVSLLSSLICPAESEYRTSSNASSNTETSRYKYNHTASNFNATSSDTGSANVITHNNPKTIKDLRRTASPSNTLNAKTAYQYAIINNDFNASETPPSSSATVHHLLDNAQLDGTVGEASVFQQKPGRTEVRRAIFSEAHEPHIKFAILLPEKPRNRRDIRILSTVRPIIEMATNVITGPEGVLQHVKIEIDYRDTQCSSTYGALGAFEIFLKRKPGINQAKIVLP